MVTLATAPTYDEALPFSNLAEQAVLGAILLDNKAYDRVSDLLSEDDFYREIHRKTWAMIVGLLDHGRSADLIAAVDRFPEHAAYFAELVTAVPSALNVQSYARTIRDKSILRQLSAIGNDICALANEVGIDPRQAAEQAENAVLGVMRRDSEQSEMMPFQKAVFDARDWMEQEHIGISTGISSLDQMTLGLQPGQLWVVGGRPSMGKSALGMQIAEHVAAKHPVTVFSLEMSAKQIAARSIKWHEHQMQDQTAYARNEAVNHLCRLKLTIDDGGKLTPGLMRMKLRRLKRQHGVSVVVVDYVQLMSVAKPENRLQEVSEVSRALKQVAKEFHCCVIAICQLNRASETRNDKRPILSDLRESGQLEQDADVVVMVHREDYYNKDTHIRGTAELLVRKCRDGQTGEVWCKFHGEYTRFTECAEPDSFDMPTRQRQRAVVVRQDWSGQA